MGLGLKEIEEKDEGQTKTHKKSDAVSYFDLQLQIFLFIEQSQCAYGSIFFYFIVNVAKNEFWMNCSIVLYLYMCY